MKKEYLVLLAAGCVFANAANVNYDLLGRKGSKMNSPMVYKNVDYSKIKKNELQKNSPLENRSLAKTGMQGNYVAVKGAFISNDGLGVSVNNGSLVKNGQYYLRRFTSSGAETCNHFCVYDWLPYRNTLSNAFIQINEDHNITPSYATASYTNLSSAGYSYSDAVTVNDNHQQASPYPIQAGQVIQYTDFNVVKNNKLKYNDVSDWSTEKKSDVGVYMDVEALPVDLNHDNQVKYVEYGNGSYTKATGYEIDATRSYRLLKKASDHYNTVVYAGKGMPNNPAGKTPQIYIGVHNSKKASGTTRTYTSKAKDIDNYIYNNRTIEFVSAGDFGFHTDDKPKMDPQAFAVNAITVGAFDPIGEEVLTYSSTANYMGTSYTGSRKPEVYNYSNFYTTDFTRTYTKGTNNYLYRPLYDGTRVATAHTAGMVADLLAINPFYRWHPEVVKALLLTSDQNVPSYKYLVFNNAGSDRYQYDSRYWNGDISKLKTRTNSNGQHEIWFVAHTLGTRDYPSNAAISWLSSGNDIMNLGKVPQNFDLYVYGSNNSDYVYFTDPAADLSKTFNVGSNRKLNFNFNNPGTLITSSTKVYNSFEKVNISSNYNYLVFKIVLKNEDENSENKGQIVLGFNMSSSYSPRPYVLH